jgi:hypothetical protein
MKDLEKPIFHPNAKIVIPLVIIFGIWFAYSFWKQEKGITNKIESCSFVTVMTPTRMPDSHKVYFTFMYNDSLVRSTGTVGAGDLGMFYSIDKILNSRYFISVYCNDLQINRVIWNVKVPDTLRFIPKKGWDKIPNNLLNN